jgi:hypothetical protein
MPDTAERPRKRRTKPAEKPIVPTSPFPVYLSDAELCDLARLAIDSAMTMERAAHKLIRMGLLILKVSCDTGCISPEPPGAPDDGQGCIAREEQS